MAGRRYPQFCAEVHIYHRCIAAWRPAIPVGLVIPLGVVQCAQSPHAEVTENGYVDQVSLQEGSQALGRGGTGVRGKDGLVGEGVAVWVGVEKR